MPQPLLVFLSPFFSSGTFACFPACFGVVLRSKLFSFLFLSLFSRLDRFNFLMHLVRHGLVLVSLFACEPSVLKLCKYGLQGLGALFQQLSLLVLHLTPLYSRRIGRKPSVRLVFFHCHLDLFGPGVAWLSLGAPSASSIPGQCNGNEKCWHHISCAKICVSSKFGMLDGTAGIKLVSCATMAPSSTAASNAVRIKSRYFKFKGASDGTRRASAQTKNWSSPRSTFSSCVSSISRAQFSSCKRQRSTSHGSG